jgi:predicted nucleic acid-binding Zn ribbon protein
MPMIALAYQCRKCGEATELLSFIPHFGERPAYRIFECGACKALTWVAQAVTARKSEPSAAAALTPDRRPLSR